VPHLEAGQDLLQERGIRLVPATLRLKPAAMQSLPATTPGCVPSVRESLTGSPEKSRVFPDTG
jgi:hypothetical protein